MFWSQQSSEVNCCRSKAAGRRSGPELLEEMLVDPVSGSGAELVHLLPAPHISSTASSKSRGGKRPRCRISTHIITFPSPLLKLESRLNVTCSREMKMRMKRGSVSKRRKKSGFFLHSDVCPLSLERLFCPGPVDPCLTGCGGTEVLFNPMDLLQEARRF